MEAYRQRSASLPKQVVYDFRLGNGGIGDMIKFFAHALQRCMDHGIRIGYIVNHSPLERYIRLVDNRMYVPRPDHLYEIQDADFPHLHPYLCNVVTPFTFYHLFQYDRLTMNLDEVFTFTEEVRNNAERVLPGVLGTPYVSVHLRLGDKYLETDRAFIGCPDDVRAFDESLVFACLETQRQRARVVFVCDNQAFKNKVNERFPDVLTPSTTIGHTSLSNTTDAQVLDAVTEFYLLVHSTAIYMGSESGFPRVAGLFKRVPVTMIQ